MRKTLVNLKRAALVLSAVAAFDIAANAQPANTWHVDDDIQVPGDGTDWPVAFDNLQDALAAAQVSDGSDLIKVAQGTYVPTDEQIPGDPRSVTFRILGPDMENTTIKGGYIGYDLASPDRRDPRRFVTILSGDIAGDDQPGFVDNDENAYHVVTYEGFTSNVVVRGFQIVGGNADVAGENEGGGMLIANAFTTIVNCTFSGNFAVAGGGAMSIAIGLGSEITCINCAFVGNAAQNRGGAIRIRDRFADCVNCVFSGNSVSDGGKGGAIYMSDPLGFEGGTLFVTNCTFSENSATGGFGGAIYQELAAQVGDTRIDNSILWGNSPDQISDNSTFGIPVNYSNIQDGWAGPGDNNIDTDPAFVDALHRLDAASPSVDAANPDQTVIPLDNFDVDDDGDETERTPERDLKVRIVNIADMGCYECREQSNCPRDVNGDDVVGINDFLIVIAEWESPPPHLADFEPACGDGTVNIQEFLEIIQPWGVCLGFTGSPPKTIEEVVTEAGLIYPDDWDTFVDAMTDPEVSEKEKANWRCWMDHYLDCHRRPFCAECACLICPDVDPYGNHFPFP